MRDVRRMAVRSGWLLALPLLVLACGGGSEPEPEMEMEMETPEPSSPPPASMGPQVTFVSPEEGGTYPADQPVRFEFAIENYELSPVPEEVDQPRPGMGHHHLGVNTDCLAPGEVIPQGDPSWIHFGDGSTTIDMQLEPGEHTMVLQLGDDEHRTQAADGLCDSVTFRVEEGI